MTFDEVENARKNYFNKRNRVIRNIVLVSVCILIALSLPSFLKGQHILSSIIFSFLQFAFFIFIIGIVIVEFYTRKELSIYHNNYKAYFVSQGLQKVFTNISYNHALGLPRETVVIVMTEGDRYHSNDLTTGCYKNINFTQADVHTEEKHTDSEGHTTYSTIFKGRFLVFDFDRDFSSNLQVASKHFYGNTLYKTSIDGRKFSKIQTESTEFNKKFKIYAQDDMDAFYILDPAFIEKVQTLYAECKHEILLSFINKKVYIAINDGKDSFEPTLKNAPLDESAEIAKVEADIRVITNFVDSLNLDRYFKGKKS